MKPNTSYVASFLIITAILLFAFSDLGLWRAEKDLARSQKVGEIRDITEHGLNGIEMENLARFAVEEHNKKENSALKFGRLVKAEEQVVSGTMYHLTLEATDEAGKIKVYETKVWVQPWINFKEMQEFKASHDSLI